MIPLRLLHCPRCHTAFAEGSDESTLPDEGHLTCAECEAGYDVRAGVADLTPPGIDADPLWATWQKHLDAFQQRRELRVNDPDSLPNKMSLSGRGQQQAFADFTGIRDGIVLDIGCGPGKFRQQLPEAVHYIGLDPIPIPEASDADFLRGVAEHLPLVDGSVRHVTVLSALDHFNDLSAFLAEANRVLEPEGCVHVIQQVHEPMWSVRGLAHAIKDAVEDRRTKHDDEVPHHMTEFSEEELRALFERDFTIERERIFSVSKLAPRRWFFTLRRRTASAEAPAG